MSRFPDSMWQRSSGEVEACTAASIAAKQDQVTTKYTGISQNLITRIGAAGKEHTEQTIAVYGRIYSM